MKAIPLTEVTVLCKHSSQVVVSEIDLYACMSVRSINIVPESIGSENVEIPWEGQVVWGVLHVLRFHSNRWWDCFVKVLL